MVHSNFLAWFKFEKYVWFPLVLEASFVAALKFVGFTFPFAHDPKWISSWTEPHWLIAPEKTMSNPLALSCCGFSGEPNTFSMDVIDEVDNNVSKLWCQSEHGMPFCSFVSYCRCIRLCAKNLRYAEEGFESNLLFLETTKHGCFDTDNLVVFDNIHMCYLLSKLEAEGERERERERGREGESEILTTSYIYIYIYPDHPMYDIYANIWLRRLEKQHWPIYGVRSQFLTTFKNLWNPWTSDNIRERCPVSPTNLIPSCSHPEGSLALNSTMTVAH